MDLFAKLVYIGNRTEFEHEMTGDKTEYKTDLPSVTRRTELKQIKEQIDPPWDDEYMAEERSHRAYDTEAPIHSFRALKEAVEAGEVSRPDVIPLLTLDAHSDPRSPIIKGWLHLYTGAPKVGKTELLFQAILNWKDERRTLWLSEEGLSVWVEKTHRTPWSIIQGDFHFAYANDKSAEWMVNVIKGMHENGGLDVVVVDTVKMLGIEEENNPSQIRRAFAPFYDLCSHLGITIILVHHDRKAGGKFGDQVSGSNSFAGSVDVIISISRNSQNDGDNKRLAEVNGRADNMRILYELDKESGEMKIIGDPSEAATLGLKVFIHEVIGEDPLTTSTIRDMLSGAGKGQVGRGPLGKLLLHMAEQGEITRIPDVHSGETVERKTVHWIRKDD